jgi:hypothetical protein
MPTPPGGFLADTSAWIELLRATGSEVDLALTDALREGRPVAVTGVVMQEVLAGCRDERHERDLRRMIAPCRSLEPTYPETYEHAAALFRRCRLAGRSVRGTVDCLIAAIAIEHGATVVALDRDMTTLHTVCGMSLWPPPKTGGSRS